MNGGDRILQQIKSDSDSAVKAVFAEAEKSRAQIMAQAEAQAEKSVGEIRMRAQEKNARAQASAKSRAELETRNALLKRRRLEIDKTVEALKEYFNSLGDKEYFDALYRLANGLKGKEGTVFLNQRDLNRAPGDFETQLSNRGVSASLSRTPAEISGGFILKCGDIEENMDFDALITSRRDEIEDLINKELFAR